MSLPNFTIAGLLPEGIHRADEHEIKQRLVDEFEDSVTRICLLSGLCRYRAELQKLGLFGEQWIDGSFVDQERLNPDDVDIVNFCHQDQQNALSAESQIRAYALIGAGKQTIETYKCHTFVVVRYPEGHPMSQGYDMRCRYWRDWFSTPQDYSSSYKRPAPERGRKGFVSMDIAASGEHR